MSAFDERLKELNPTLRITRDAYARDLTYMNHYDERSRRWMRDLDACLLYTSTPTATTR